MHSRSNGDPEAWDAKRAKNNEAIFQSDRGSQNKQGVVQKSVASHLDRRARERIGFPLSNKVELEANSELVGLQFPPLSLR